MQGIFSVFHSGGGGDSGLIHPTGSDAQLSDMGFVLDPVLLEQTFTKIRFVGRLTRASMGDGLGTVQFKIYQGGSWSGPDTTPIDGVVVATSPVFTPDPNNPLVWTTDEIELGTDLTRIKVTYQVNSTTDTLQIGGYHVSFFNDAPIDTCGLPFYFDSAQVLDQGKRIRLWFTRETAPGPVTGQFTLTPTSGQSAPTITMVTKASDDTDVYDLYLSSPMQSGTYTVSVSNFVLSASGHGLLEPRSFAFDWTPIAQEPIAHGATNSAAEEQFLKGLNPAFRKRPNWQALAAALAAGDATTREDARRAFDQLYVSTASGKYLERRAGDAGIEKPMGPGLSDELFRQLALTVRNNKLTSDALLDVAEVFYGPDSVHAYVETDLYEPYKITAGSTLEVLIDERTSVGVTFPRAHFTKPLRATATEVAAGITRALEARRLRAWAIPYTDPETGLRRVRIYSGTSGLRSSVRVTGGTAQPALRFPSALFVEPDVAPADYGVWTITKPTSQTARWTYVGDFYSFQNVREDDYVVIRGVEFDLANRGAGPIAAVNFETGAMWFEVNNPAAVAQVDVMQCEFGDIEFFRATRRTTYDYDAHAIVHQAGGEGFATIAATTRAIQRGVGTGAYLQVATAIAGDTAARVGTTVTVATVDPHGLSVGDWFTLDGPDDGSFTGPGMAGTHRVATVPGASSLTFQTPDHNFNAVADGDFTLTPLAAPAGEAKGPFIFDPDDGFGLTGTDGTTQDRLEVGQRYALLRLAPGEGDDFPDEEGWLVFRLGYSNQVGPVKYLGNTGADTLLLDASFQFPATIEIGSFVTLLETRGPFVPSNPTTVGSFYLTDSPSGRVAAEQTMRDISAAGIELDVEIRYPGDRGLGGEGLPARDARKLSDKVAVWGGSDLDAELEEKRGTE